MKRLQFSYYMQIDYREPVSRCSFTIKCLPENSARQFIEETHIELMPPVRYSEGRDGLGNAQIYGLNEQPHTTFYFRLTGTARTGLADYEEEENEDQTMIYKYPHGLSAAGSELKAYHEKHFKSRAETDDNRMIAGRMMEQLHRDFSYRPGCTSVSTGAEEAFKLGCGVCQDYAHILIALLRLSGIPARYVTGLLIGEGVSHAWVEIWQDHKWYGLDPTNRMWVNDKHIRIGVGRDARDCLINRGIMHGGGLQTQTVEVNVLEIYDRQ